MYGQRVSHFVTVGSQSEMQFHKHYFPLIPWDAFSSIHLLLEMALVTLVSLIMCAILHASHRKLLLDCFSL